MRSTSTNVRWVSTDVRGRYRGGEQKSEEGIDREMGVKPEPMLMRSTFLGEYPNSSHNLRRFTVLSLKFFEETNI